MNYLGDEWIEAADAALMGAAARFGEVEVAIAHTVAGARSYLVSLSANSGSVTVIDPAEIPDNAICFEQDWSTACLIATQQSNAHQAFLLGDIRFAGDIATLIANADVLDEVAAALQPVMARTAFPPTFSR